MKKTLVGARIILGLVYLIFGLNGFFNFIPVPEQPERAKAFIDALIETGYMLYFWKGVEVIGGLMLIANFKTPLASIILFPITLNILAFHLFLDPLGLPIGVLLMALNLYLGLSQPIFAKSS